MSGPVAHLVPFLRDRALSVHDAAAFASLLGITNLISRPAMGFILDRVNGPLPGLPVLVLGAIGVILPVLFGVPFAAAAVLMLGFAIGSEFDLLAYFVSRYFGLRAYATVFGWNFGMVALGAAIGPVMVGWMRDQQGDYRLGFVVSGACLAVAGLLCPFLGRYRFAT
jgi:MFS family permease